MSNTPCVNCSAPCDRRSLRCRPCATSWAARCPVLRECQCCGTWFTSVATAGDFNGNRRYCTKECSSDLRDWRRSRRVLCAHCGEPFRAVLARRKFCSQACSGAAQRRRAECDPHVTRGRREISAPGLRRPARTALLGQWRREGRRCVYCLSPVECVDHVVPLVRGGTNHEGNLAPCCWRCNSSKSGLLVIEWRSGLRLSRRTLFPWVSRQFSPVVGEQVALDFAGW